MFFKKVPLAALNLIHNKRKTLLSILGVTFAVVVMFIEVGFYLSFFDKNVTLIRKLNADIVVMSKSKLSLIFTQKFPKSRLYQAANMEGVLAVHPVYIERSLSLWKNSQYQTRSIRAIGVDVKSNAINIPEISYYQEELLLPGSVLMDRQSRSCYGPKEINTVTELASRQVQIIGNFDLGPDFSNHGNIIMSEENFALFFQRGTRSSLDDVSLGLIQVQTGYSIESVKQNLLRQLEEDIQVYTLQEYEDQEIDFWQKTSPVGPLFMMGTVAGFLVGIIICYQVLYSNIMSYLKQFAMVKAFGFHNSYLLKIILQEALLLSLLGFGIAFAFTQGVAYLIAQHSSINITVDIYVSGIILCLAVVMCTIAGLIAAKRAFLADPADLF